MQKKLTRREMIRGVWGSKPLEPEQMVATISQAACIAHLGTFCFSCLEACGEENAVELVAGKPKIQSSLCSGCGQCTRSCPAPGGAIIMMPMKVVDDGNV